MKNSASSYRYFCLVILLVVFVQTATVSFSEMEKKPIKTEQTQETEINAAFIEAVIPVAHFDLQKIILPTLCVFGIQKSIKTKFKPLQTHYLSYFENLFLSSIQTLAP